MLRPHIDTLLLHDPDRALATVNVWVSHPTAAEERTFGKIFLLSYLNQASRINYEIIQLIQEEFKTTFYQAADTKPQLAFEQSLQKINLRLHQLILDGVSQWVQHAHFLAGVIHHDQLIVTSVGPMGAFIVRQGRIHNILGSETHPTVNPLRIFENVIYGQLQPDDRLLLCTPELLDYFSIEKVRRTIMDHTPVDAVRAFEASLLGVEHNVAFAAMVVWCETVQVATPLENPLPAIATSTNPVAPQRSMEQLIAREHATAKLLSPSVWPAVRDLGQQLTTATLRFVQTTLLRRPAKRVLPFAVASSFPRPSRLGSGIRQAGSAASSFVQFFSKTKRALWPARPKPISTPATTQSTRPNLKSHHQVDPLNWTVLWWQQLSRARQIVSASLLVFLVLLAGSLMVNLQPDKVKVTNRPSEAISLIQDHISKAQAALLYGGEDAARQQFQAAQALLATLPNRTKRDQTQRQPLAQALTSIEQRLSHLTVIDRPVWSVSLKFQNQPINATGLILVGAQLALLDSANNTVYVTTAGTTSALEPIKQPGTSSQMKSFTAISATRLLALTSQNTFVEVDLAKKTVTARPATWPTVKPQPVGLSFFQNRIYSLDTTARDIIRFTRSSTSLGTGAPWLQSTVDLSQAKDITVDGTIFVLQPKASIISFGAGRPTDFRLNEITPAVKNITKIWTSPDTNYLYALDAETKRLVVFDKSGSLVDQYRSDRWNTLKDFSIDLKNKRAYVLFGTTVEQFTLLSS